MPVHRAQITITNTVSTWEGVSAHPHRFGGTEYRVGRREIGHIHGDHLLDIPYPRRIRDQVVAEGVASPHHILPDTGWVSFYLRQPEDIDRAIELIDRSYKVALAQRIKRGVPKDQNLDGSS